jgi:hypothetical protein
VINANTDGLKLFAKQLKKAVPEVSAQMRTGIKAGGTLIANAAKQKAPGVKIRPTIKVRVVANAAKVSAGNRNVPIAAMYELGHSPKSSGWWHPVFPQGFSSRSTWNWVQQPRPHRPYLHPALRDMTPEAKKLVTEAVMSALVEVLEG